MTEAIDVHTHILPRGWEDFAARFGCSFESIFGERITEVMALGLIEIAAGVVRLTPRGMLLGNEVFARLLPDAAT